MKIQRQSANHVAGDVCQCQSCDVVHLLRGVQWDETVHGDLISLQA